MNRTSHKNSHPNPHSPKKDQDQDAKPAMHSLYNVPYAKYAQPSRDPDKKEKIKLPELRWGDAKMLR